MLTKIIIVFVCWLLYTIYILLVGHGIGYNEGFKAGLEIGKMRKDIEDKINRLREEDE